MYFWLKFFHIAAMAVWFTGLFLLPRLFIARTRSDDAAEYAQGMAIASTLFFGFMTPAALLTVIAGTALIAFGFHGPWLPAKLALVALLVLQHIYYGQLLLDLNHGRVRHGEMIFRLLNWIPLLLLLAIAALVAAKPGSLPPLGAL